MQEYVDGRGQAYTQLAVDLLAFLFGFFVHTESEHYGICHDIFPPCLT